MIQVKKPLSRRPKEWHNIALEETKKAIAHFGKQVTRRTKFTFKVYKRPELKAALHQIFHGKCAYCEFDYAASQPGDVEHFRPKAHYYWLAAEWRNLLPSCRDCNCQRRHKFPNGRVELRGKGDRFPLVNPKSRARGPGGERNERPLLLSPTNSTLERHLEFIVDFASPALGQVRPALLTRVRESKKGRHSIETYGLDRPDLAKARMGHAKRIHFLVTSLTRTCHELEVAPNSRRIRSRLDREVRELADGFLAEDKRFLGMARQLIFPLTSAMAKRLNPKLLRTALKPVLPPTGYRR